MKNTAKQRGETHGEQDGGCGVLGCRGKRCGGGSTRAEVKAHLAHKSEKTKRIEKITEDLWNNYYTLRTEQRWKFDFDLKNLTPEEQEAYDKYLADRTEMDEEEHVYAEEIMSEIKQNGQVDVPSWRVPVLYHMLMHRKDCVGYNFYGDPHEPHSGLFFKFSDGSYKAIWHPRSSINNDSNWWVYSNATLELVDMTPEQIESFGLA